MNIDLIKNEICVALANEPYSETLRKIKIDDGEGGAFLRILEDIVEEQYLHSPKDIPYSHKLHNKVTSSYYGLLTQIVRWNINVLYQAKINDYLWGTSQQIEFAKAALLQYIEYIRKAKKSREVFAALYRTIDLSRRVNGKDASLTDASELWGKIYTQCDPAKRKKLLALALNYQLKDAEQIAQLIEVELPCLQNKPGEVELVKAFADLFEKACPIKKESRKEEKERTNRIRRIAIDTLVTASRSAQKTPVYRAHLLEQAIQRLKKIDDTAEERKRLLQERSNVQKQMLSQMHTHHHEMDMTEEITKYYQALETLNKEESFYFISMLFPLFDPDEMTGQVTTRAESSLAVFFKTNLMDAGGRTSATIPAMLSKNQAEAIEAHSIHDTLLFMDIYGFLVAHILDFMNKRFDLNQNDVRRIVEHSGFVMPERSKLFETGLFAGFQKDFITAINVLIPQVENSIRCLLQDSGVIVYNLKDDGTEEAKTLHALLDLPETAEILEADLLFTLKAVFCSKYGLNLRNENSHGLLSDGFFFSQRAYYVWWLIFRMCYSLNGREVLRHYDSVISCVKAVWSEHNAQEHEEKADDRPS